jgi:hypothetical protein
MVKGAVERGGKKRGPVCLSPSSVYVCIWMDASMQKEERDGIKKGRQRMLHRKPI